MEFRDRQLGALFAVSKAWRRPLLWLGKVGYKVLAGMLGAEGPGARVLVDSRNVAHGQARGVTDLRGHIFESMEKMLREERRKSNAQLAVATCKVGALGAQVNALKTALCARWNLSP